MAVWLGSCQAPVPSSAPASPPSERYHYETRDPDAGLAYLSQAYGIGLRSRGRADRYLLRHDRCGPGPFYVDKVVHNVNVEYDTEPLNMVLVARADRGSVRMTRCGTTENFGPSDLFLASQVGEPYTFQTLPPSNFTLTSIHPTVVAEVAADRPGEDRPPLSFESLVPVSAGARQHLARTVAYVTGVAANDHAAAQPLVVAEASRLLAAAVLTSFPNNWMTRSGHQDRLDRLDATGRCVALAMEFIDAHADDSIGPADIAAAAKVGVRAVQLAFRRHHDTTPMAYLRAVRLRRAHEALVAAQPGDGTTVTQVSLQWGFTNPGRFAEMYRATYGEQPSRTLGRIRS